MIRARSQDLQLLNLRVGSDVSVFTLLFLLRGRRLILKGITA